jgi:hypothetical protein
MGMKMNHLFTLNDDLKKVWLVWRNYWLVFMVCTLTSFLLVTGCTNQAPPESEQAKQALTDFFKYISQGDYAKADQLYAGDYQTLIDWNPEVDPNNHQMLWENACAMNGLQCLKLRSATLREVKGNEYVFTVEFSNPDGSLFVLGPCCGATETEMPSVSQFDYTIQKDAEGQFKTVDLPVFIP